MGERRRLAVSTRVMLIGLLIGLPIGMGAGCSALNYDEPATSEAADPAAWPSTAEASAPADAVDVPAAAASGAPHTTRRETPTRARLSDQRNAETTADAEKARSWRELASMARESAQAGDLERADELLAQAALQLQDLRPTNTQRRTVFGMRARLANDLAAYGKVAEADALADQLFAEARNAPALGDASLVTLARATADRRAKAAKEAGRKESQLPLLALAFDAAQSGTASRERLGLAFEVSTQALREGDLTLARRAIDQCLLDARIIAPSDRMQTAALKIYKARIALAQKDLTTAEAAAQTAVQIFDEQKANASNRGVAEATLAQVLAEKGESAKALELGSAAYARLSGGETIVPHARRQIAARFARVEWLAGQLDAAGAHYREALAIPSDGTNLDDDLIQDVKAALAELELSAGAPRPS